jgi:HK97 family phage portal protein
VIVRTRGGRNRELRAFALTDTVRWGYQGLRNLQPHVGEREMLGIPAIHRAVRLRAEAIASLQLRCWRGDGPTRDRVDTVWQARLFAGNPNPVQTRFGFWETVETSLCVRGNAYIWKNVDPKTGKVTDWWALHPDQVRARYNGGRIVYRILVAHGYVDPVGKGPGQYDVDSSTILHVRGHGQGGQLEAPSPVTVFREALAGPIGRQQHEARMWRRGTAIQQAVTFPAGVPKEQADQWREVFRSSMEGANGETTLVVGAGAEVKAIGLTPADAKFVELANLTVEDASRMMAVPANLLGVQVVKVRTNLEEDLMAWLRFGLGPELWRIEDAVGADEQLFGVALTYPGFDTDGFVRGDLLTEATVLQSRVQSGILVPDEARHILGYGPLPDGAGQIPQITPVGGAPNPLPLPKPGGGSGDNE